MSFGKEIRDGRDAEICNQDRQSDGDGVIDTRWLRFPGRALGAPDDHSRKNSSQECIIKTGEKWNDGDVVQKRKIAADDEKQLKSDEQDTGNMSNMPRAEGKPRNDQFDEMIPGGSEFVEPMWREMQIPADWTRNRLRLVVVVKAGEIAPAGIAPQLDQAGADHNAEAEPAK